MEIMERSGAGLIAMVQNMDCGAQCRAPIPHTSRQVARGTTSRSHCATRVPSSPTHRAKPHLRPIARWPTAPRKTRRPPNRSSNAPHAYSSLRLWRCDSQSLDQRVETDAKIAEVGCGKGIDIAIVNANRIDDIAHRKP